MKKRNIFVDIFKIALVYLVVCTHFHPYFLQSGIFRLAVPAFFMISGFFQYSNDEQVKNKKAINFVKSSIKYLLIGFLIYMIYDISIAIKDDKKISSVISTFVYKDFLLNFGFYNYPITTGYHLWYLVSIVVVSIINYFIIKTKNEKIYKFTFLLLAVPLFFSGLLYRINEDFVGTNITRNALFTGLPLFSIGYELARRNKKRAISELIIFFMLGCIFFYIQHIEKIYLFTRQIEFYFSSVLSSIFFILFFTNLPKLPEILNKIFYLIFGKSCSLYVYIFHLMIGNILINYYEYKRSWEVCKYSFWGALAIAIIINWITLLTKFVVNRFKKKEVLT